MRTELGTIGRPRRLALAFAATLLGGSAMAQPPEAPATIAAHALRGGAYWVDGGRANVGFVVAPRGVILLDTEMTPDTAKAELAAIAKVTPKPVAAIVISHADPDHVGGLDFYPRAPVVIHENAKDEIIAAANDPTAAPPYHAMYQALLPRMPADTIGSSRTMELAGVRIAAMYFGPAHTAGDLVVYLPAQKVVYGADLLVNNMRFPVAHLGGSTLGWITAAKAMLALDADTFVPGHGPIETRAQLQARVRAAEERRNAIKAMVAQGKSLAEIEQALPDKADNPMFLTYTQTVYQELTKGYPPPPPPWANIIKR